MKVNELRELSFVLHDNALIILLALEVYFSLATPLNMYHSMAQNVWGYRRDIC